MSEQYFTTEQREDLARRAGELGDGGVQQAEREWAELIDAVKAEQAAGTEPTDPRMVALAQRWQSLIEQFTAGNEGIRQSLSSMYRAEGPQAASRGTVDAEVMQYVGQAIAALQESSPQEPEKPADP